MQQTEIRSQRHHSKGKPVFKRHKSSFNSHGSSTDIYLYTQAHSGADQRTRQSKQASSRTVQKTCPRKRGPPSTNPFSKQANKNPRDQMRESLPLHLLSYTSLNASS